MFDPLTQLVMIIFLGVLSQWIAWKINMPSILLLLTTGLIAGPVTNIVQPDALFGNLLFPIVSISVAIILFEGGLNLKFSELRGTGKVVLSLVTIGAAVTWILSTFLAYWILDCSFAFASLFGAILIVTGPTVVIPLLKHIRPKKEISSMLRWEGILIDPVGAIFAFLVFETILASSANEAMNLVIWGVVKSTVVGAGIGFVFAVTIIFLLKFYQIPDFLKSPICLASALLSFAISNLVQEESGLLTVTIMGIVIANQKHVKIGHIIHFKENLTVILIAVLFMILISRLELNDILKNINVASFTFLLLSIFLVRPLSVFASTFRSNLSRNEKIFSSWMAPRGIVAAAVASIFSFYLAKKGYPEFENLASLIFLMIFGTVIIYSLTAPILARKLKLSSPNSQGLVMVGSNPWVCEIAKTLQKYNIQILIVDTNRANIQKAKMSGLRTCCANVFSEYFWEEADLYGIGRMLALTPNEEANSLIAVHFSEMFDGSNLYQLASNTDENERSELQDELQGRILFGSDITYSYLSKYFTDNGLIKATLLTEEYTFENYKTMYPHSISLFVIDDEKNLQIITEDTILSPEAGETIISMIKLPQENA